MQRRLGRMGVHWKPFDRRAALMERLQADHLVVCGIPEDLAGELWEPLADHFPGAWLVVERRRGERRSPEPRRRASSPDVAVERRTIRTSQGRRDGDRRRPSISLEPTSLPPEAHPHADRLAFSLVRVVSAPGPVEPRAATA